MFHEKYLYFELNGTDTNDLLFVILTRNWQVRSVCFVSSFLFFLDCTREADRNYTSLVTLHFARLKNLQQRYDITTDVRYDRLTRSPNLMVTQGRPWTKGRQCIRLCLMHALSGSIGRACLYRRVKAVANMSGISTGGIFLAKADHTWLMSRPSGSVHPRSPRGS